MTQKLVSNIVSQSIFVWYQYYYNFFKLVGKMGKGMSGHRAGSVGWDYVPIQRQHCPMIFAGGPIGFLGKDNPWITVLIRPLHCGTRMPGSEDLSTCVPQTTVRIYCSPSSGWLCKYCQHGLTSGCSVYWYFCYFI